MELSRPWADSDYRSRQLPGLRYRPRTDLLLVIQLLEQGDDSARSAAWFYAAKGSLKHSGDVKAVTKIINGGTNGLDDLQACYDKAKSVLL